MTPRRYLPVLLAFCLLSGLASAQTPETSTPLPPARQLETRGDVLMARKLYREATDTYSQALKLDPRNAVLLNKIGISVHQQTRLEEARKYYERSIRANRNYAEAYNNLGAVHYARKKYKKAMQLFRKGVELKPDAASIHSNLGTAYFARKMFDEALREFNTALELDPAIFDPHRGFGVMLQERTVEERALFHFYLAKAFASRNNMERCLEFLKKAFEDGFRDVKRIEQDADFALVRQNEQYHELLRRMPAVLEP